MPRFKRPKCAACDGKGYLLGLSFSDPKKEIRRECAICWGKKVAKCQVDLYDVLEYLYGVGTGGFVNAAQALEFQFTEQLPSFFPKSKAKRKRPTHARAEKEKRGT